MAFFVKLYNFLAHEIKKPKMYGIFHIFSLLTTAFLTTFLCKKHKSSSEKTERRIALWVWIVLVLFEAYKQFIYLFEVEESVLIVNYGWGSFPFQLCSAPLYVLPLIAFLPSGKLREAFAAFYGSFVLLGGIAVCFYPGNVFVETLGVNLHTMIWHGSQVFLGIYFNIRRFYTNKGVNIKKYFFSALPIFLSVVLVAMTLNFGIYQYLTANAIDSEFNMFFISPYYECIFPVLKTIQAYTPYPVFLFSYIAILSVFSFVLLFVENAAVQKFIKKVNETSADGTSLSETQLS